MSSEWVAVIVGGLFYCVGLCYTKLRIREARRCLRATDAQITQAIIKCGSVRQKILALNAPLSLHALEKLTYDCLHEEENATVLRAQKNAATNFQSETFKNEGDK